MGQVVIHQNPNLDHQRKWAQAFKQAIPGAYVTSQPTLTTLDPDIHIINGPNYCYKYWLGKPNVLMIDRAYWGDPDHVSIGWLKADGTRIFASGRPERPRPAIKPWKEYRGSACVFAGYREEISDLVKLARKHFERVYCRHHPADKQHSGLMELGGELSTIFALCDVAVGTKSTVLYDAVFNGLPTIGEVGSVRSYWGDLRRPDRSEWLHELSYRQFHIDEVRNGLAWELLNVNNLRKLATTDRDSDIDPRTAAAG